MFMALTMMDDLQWLMADIIHGRANELPPVYGDDQVLGHGLLDLPGGGWWLVGPRMVYPNKTCSWLLSLLRAINLVAQGYPTMATLQLPGLATALESCLVDANIWEPVRYPAEGSACLAANREDRMTWGIVRVDNAYNTVYEYIVLYMNIQYCIWIYV